MALNLAKLVLGYLKERPDEKLTARQIAEWIFATFPNDGIHWPPVRIRLDGQGITLLESIGCITPAEALAN